jgi:uracil-DNA glycosylase
MDDLMKDFFGEWMSVVDKPKLNYALNTLRKETRPYSPNPQNIFKAFNSCAYHNLRCVFLGQDPYPQEGVATGVAFANSLEMNGISPSLKVLLESARKYYNDIPYGFGELDKTLSIWQEQGVLLLNSALTVVNNRPGSHMFIWRPFVSSLLNNIAVSKPNVIFVLFGDAAKSLKEFIGNSSYIETIHPSFCSRNNILLPDIFKQIDDIMVSRGEIPIYWL